MKPEVFNERLERNCIWALEVCCARSNVRSLEDCDGVDGVSLEVMASDRARDTSKRDKVGTKPPQVHPKRDELHTTQVQRQCLIGRPQDPHKVNPGGESEFEKFSEAFDIVLNKRTRINELLQTNWGINLLSVHLGCLKKGPKPLGSQPAHSKEVNFLVDFRVGRHRRKRQRYNTFLQVY